MPSLTRPCLALLVPALGCHGLSVPKLAFPYPIWLCPVQHSSSPRPCPVLLTMLDPVRSCLALLNTDRPFCRPARSFSASPGADWCCSVSLCLALSCPTLLGHGRPCTNLPSSALRCQLFYHGPPSLVLSYPAWPWTALHCHSCPCPVLLPMPGLVQPYGTR